MLAFFAALLAAAPAPSPAPATPAPATPEAAPETATVPSIAADAAPPLETAAPWWEKITVTVDDKGKQQSCRYETNLKRAESCEPAIAASIRSSGKDGIRGVYKKVTFERRFSPGAATLDAGKLQPGDLLLGRSVMFLTIDAKGAIESCKVVATSGEAPPDYDCDEVKQEQFRAAASAGSEGRQAAFLTVLAYGHTESIA